VQGRRRLGSPAALRRARVGRAVAPKRAPGDESVGHVRRAGATAPSASSC